MTIEEAKKKIEDISEDSQWSRYGTLVLHEVRRARQVFWLEQLVLSLVMKEGESR